MTRLSQLVAALAASALAAPAVAQMDHSKMNMPGMTMPMPARKAAPKKITAKKVVAKKAVAKPVVKKAPPKAKPAARKPAARKADAPRPRATPRAARAVDPHAGHDMSTMPTAAIPAADPHAGHDMAAMPAMPATPAGTDLPAGNAPPPSAPTDHAADAVYGAAAMGMGRHHLDTMHGGQKFSQVLVNIAEYQVRRGRDSYEWDGEAWYGGDIDRLWLKSQGDGEVGRGVDRAEVQALFSRAVDPYFNLQAGLRYDIRPNPSRVYAVLGVEGLAPRFFDVEAALFLSNKGELSARGEASYDQRITQRLILQPRVELNFAAQNVREIGVGKGLGDAELGLRLRYEVRREFAPYVGVQYRRAFGRTRDYLRADGQDAGGLSLLAGVRMWF